MQSLKLRKTIKISHLVVLICLFSFSLASADWFESSLHKVTPISGTGDVNVQFRSAETPEEWSGLARGIVVASDPGSNAIIATLLTALSLGYDVTIQMDNTPTWAPQVITGCSVVAP